jgi:hypothetical protein
MIPRIFISDEKFSYPVLSLLQDVGKSVAGLMQLLLQLANSLHGPAEQSPGSEVP